VSVALASIVMREAPGASAATRVRVLEVAERLGYRPDRRARLLRSGRSRLLGVVFGVQYDYHGELVAGLYDAAEAIGYELTLSAVTPRRPESRAIAGLLQDRCEALILLGPQTPTAALVQLHARMPVIAVARAIRGGVLDVVRTDDREGLRLAVDHLVGLGHTRIAHVDGGRLPGSAERRRGYRDGMREHGLEAGIRVVPGGFDEEDGVRAAYTLLDDPPTAVAMYNDRSAAGLLDALRRAGRSVPGDLSVVGYDDSRLAALDHIDLTTVAQDTAAMTTLAVARAVDRIEQRTVTRRETVIPPRLVVRGTTGRLG
jgi:DNA-binding LacI/PurR family transcriptional regulator